MSSHRLRDLATLSLLILAAGASHALGIGRPQGATLLGRPLDLQVPVSLDPGMSAGDLCPEAEVAYGDQRINPRNLDLQVLPAGEGQAMLRLRVATPLEEPYAGVQVRVGCSQRLARRFVLLVEDPAAGGEPPAAPVTVAVSAAAATAAAAAPAAAGPVGATPNAAAAATVGTGGAPASVANIAVRGAAATPPADTTPGASTQAPAPRAAPAPAPAPQAGSREGRPRLRLDPPETALAAAPAAAASRAPAPLPLASASGPLDAASAAASGQDESARLQALEGELKNLQQALRSSQAQAAALSAQLAQAEQGRYLNPLVILLALTSILALGGVVVLARRARSQPAAWWLGTGIPGAAGDRSTRPAPEGRTGPLSLDLPGTPGPAPAAGGAPAASRGAGAVAPAPALRDAASVAADAQAPAPAPWRANGAALPAGGLPPEDAAQLSSNELSDVRQETDFFLALGEDERAIEVLRNHLQSQPQASAMPWFDLLEIYHRMGRKADYEEVRRDFEWRYEARVPAFEHYDPDPAGLDAYPDILSRIVAAWPTPEVVKVIDEAIFRPPAGSRGKPLSLAAYRDLLFLHQVLRDLSEGGASAALAMVTPSRLAALAVASAAKALPAAPAAAATPRPSARVLDIDLDRVLGQASAAREPARGAIDMGPQRAKGMDELLDFKLDTRGSDKPRTGGGPV